jgi:2-oxoisovalerate dehydrogenase E2 component (dihydrolipoyl transacylase)
MEHVVKMPDVGEGIAEAELVEWHVGIGDPVREDMIVAAVMTDKATVEIPSPASGTVTWLGGAVGDRIAVKAPLIRIEAVWDEPREAVEDVETAAGAIPQVASVAAAEVAPKPAIALEIASRQARHVAAKPADRPLASPAVRLRAMEAGIDLRQVKPTGPAGRITHEDLDRHIQQGEPPPAANVDRKRTGVTEIKVTGLRRRIAERMSIAANRIPHITYVEEVDMTALEELRTKLNQAKGGDAGKLTILPFLMKAIARAVEEHKLVNATFDDEKGVILQHEAVHIGIATQTPSGLMVPVVRHVEARTLGDCSAEVARVSQAARDGSATRDELTGSTITISSLGALGGLVSTPIINHPEVAIVGVNKLVVKPVWDGSQFVPRKCMNLSSSFDHRIVDGWDAARFIQRVKALMETPAMIFLEG